MRRTIAVVTSSRADYSHLYWPLRDLAGDGAVELKLIVMASHLSPEFGTTVREIEQDGPGRRRGLFKFGDGGLSGTRQVDSNIDSQPKWRSGLIENDDRIR